VVAARTRVTSVISFVGVIFIAESPYGFIGAWPARYSDRRRRSTSSIVGLLIMQFMKRQFLNVPDS